jgi:signal transduction histidine kinase
MSKHVTKTFTTLVLPAICILAIGYLDYSLGFGFNLFPLYLIPLALIAWKRSLPVTLGSSVLAGLVVILKFFMTKHFYAQGFFWYWDGLVKFTLLVLYSGGLWRIRQLQLLQQRQSRQKIRELNRSLQQQVDRLTAANRELADVSYTISHDLRAPLRHIAGFVELLNANSREQLNEQSRHYLQVIAGSTEKMGALVDGLLAFAHLGRTELVLRPVDLNRLVNEVIAALTPEFTEREIEWQVARLPEVVGDASLLREVFYNLLANALKFTRTRPSAKIEVGSYQSDTETVFFVRDNGVGFDSRYVHKLFGIFQRLHAAEEFAGVGIGLANVQRIVARHGGRVWAEGVVDGGATFWFSLPIGPPP